VADSTKVKKLRAEGLDYFLAAVAPVLIIGMIGSLVFFLIVVSYGGNFRERLMWNLGLYTFASVLVARIAIEQSRQLAFAYMFALAAATLVMTPQIFVIRGPLAVFSLPIMITLLVIVAYLADRITFDCALMSENHQSSGIGLLQSLGLVENEREQSEFDTKMTPAMKGERSDQSMKARARKHNPGVWVLYFAMFAMPVFGIGQLFLRDPSDRRWGFIYLFVYLACSFSLLVMIALLSLRKYLRERGVPMETSFAVRWLTIGIASILLLLGGIALLPMPSQSMFALDMPFKFTDREDLLPNRWGWGEKGLQGENARQGDQQFKQRDDRQGEEEAGNKDARDANRPEQQGNGQQNNEPQDQGKRQSDPKSTNEPEQKPKQGKSSDASDQNNPRQENDTKAEQPASETEPSPRNGRPDDNQQPNGDRPRQNEEKPQENAKPQNEGQQQNNAQNPNNVQQQDNEARNQQPDPQPSIPRQIEWNITAAIQWLIWLIMAIIALVLIVVYRRELLQSAREFIEWLRRLLGRRRNQAIPVVVHDGPTLIENPYPPFHSFNNPFAFGNRWTREQIVRHIYRASLSWGYEHKIARSEEETPEEYMRRLARRFPQQQELIGLLGCLYSRIAYARGKISAEEIKPMNDLWNWLASTMES
jgi:hypothetical protein